MKRMLIVAVIVTLTLASSILTLAQSKTDFSGRWRYNQQLSDKATSGNSPTIFFPEQLYIHQTAAEVNVEARNYRQDPVMFVYKFDGSETISQGESGVTASVKAAWDGAKLVVTSKRSFSSPAGEITIVWKEVYSVAGDTLTVEKTETTTGAVTETLKAIYKKDAS
jgi:hypothetical protein